MIGRQKGLPGVSGRREFPLGTDTIVYFLIFLRQKKITKRNSPGSSAQEVTETARTHTHTHTCTHTNTHTHKHANERSLEGVGGNVLSSRPMDV